ncbi:MAG: hypothetical protein ISS48_00270, partial [Candidatus Aenigmarchaeota archaeon]|nr:hypothetical protein [Candidatus Aenigmarchaeota archaeon]
ESAIVPLSGFEDVAFSVVPCDEEYNEIGITGSCTIEDIYDVSNSKPEYTDSIEIEFRDNKGGHIEHSYVADINAKLIYQCPTGEEIVIVNSIDPRTATTFIIDNIRSGLTSGISPMDFKLRVYYTPNDEEEMVEYDYISPYPTVTQVGGPSTVPIKNIIILETFDCSSLCLTEQPDRIGFARERDDTFWKQFLDEWNCPDLETDDEANADFIKEAFKEYIQNPEYEQERMICNFRLDIEGSDDSPKYTIKMKAVNRGVSDPLFILRGGNKPYIFQQMLSEYPLNSVYLNFGKWVKGNT